MHLYFSAMVRGWWWIKDPEELHSTLQALHPRGVREKVLHKHLAKHMESLTELCTKPVSGECTWTTAAVKWLVHNAASSLIISPCSHMFFLQLLSCVLSD